MLNIKISKMHCLVSLSGLEVPDGAAEPKQGEALVVNRVVVVGQRLDSTILSVEYLCIRAHFSPIALRDDFVVLLGLLDGDASDWDAKPGCVEVEPPGPDLEGNLGREVRSLRERGTLALTDRL